MASTVPAPITAAMLVPANGNIGKPRYGTAGDWAGGVTVGDDPGLPVNSVQAFQSANVALASASGGAPAADYTPRNQYQRATQLGVAGAVSVVRDRGTIAPAQRYPIAADTPVAAPVVTSLVPNTIATGPTAVPLAIAINGTGFTPYSRVITGGSGSPWDSSCKYISATELWVLVDPRTAVPGAISVAVVDHSVLSNTDKLFTFT